MLFLHVEDQKVQGDFRGSSRRHQAGMGEGDPIHEREAWHRGAALVRWHARRVPSHRQNRTAQ